MTDLAVRRVGVVRVDAARQMPDSDAVAVEQGLEVRLAGEPFAVIMRTPGGDRDLTCGFLFSEGVIGSADDVVSIDQVGDHIVDVCLAPACAERVARDHASRRRVTMNASCGMCGRPSLAATRMVAPTMGVAWTVPAEVLAGLPERLRCEQRTFDETGGLHAAALTTRSGDVVASAEDVGRHNAVDRVVGRMLVEGSLPLADRLLMVSGRTSFEIVQKAWLAGIPIVASVSAPSSLAIELADEAGMTLVGFVRGPRCNIYTHAGRITLGPHL